MKHKIKHKNKLKKNRLILLTMLKLYPCQFYILEIKDGLREIMSHVISYKTYTSQLMTQLENEEIRIIPPTKRHN
jgi:hypothetical protein